MLSLILPEASVPTCCLQAPFYTIQYGKSKEEDHHNSMPTPIQAMWAEDEEEDIGTLRKKCYNLKILSFSEKKTKLGRGEFCPFGEKSQKQGKTFAVI